MKRLLPLMVVVCLSSGCLRPFLQRLDHISRQLDDANDMMKHATIQLEEANQRAATLERAAKMFFPNLDKKTPKQSSVDDPPGLEIRTTAWNDKWPSRGRDDQAEIATLEHDPRP